MTDRDTIFYIYSKETATVSGELDKWNQSHLANIECKDAIDEAISNEFKDNKLNRNCAKSIIDRFGFDRTNFILKCTVRHATMDDRYSDDNKKWASAMRMSTMNITNDYVLKSHPTLINGFIEQARKEWDNLLLYDSSHIDESERDYEGKILALHPDTLYDKYKSPRYQLFLATCGFGCSPTAIGRSVSGKFLADEEFATFNRSDFYGVIDEKYLPEWAIEKANEILGISPMEQEVT